MAECNFCHKPVIPPPADPVIVNPNDPEVVALLRKIGRRCHACGKISCQPCAYKAAQKKGVRHFTCPKCGADIHENPLEAPEKKPWWQKLLGGGEKDDAQKEPEVDSSRPFWVLVLVDREPLIGRETHLRRLLASMMPDHPLARAALQVTPDYENPYMIGLSAEMLGGERGFKCDLEKLEYRSYQAADGVSGTLVSIFKK